MPTTTGSKPLKCRLGLHDYEVRRNPETAERFEICVRCDHYREKAAMPMGY